MTDIQQEVTVEVEGRDGQPVKLTVRPPNSAVRRQIERAMRKAYCEAVRAGHPTDEQAGPDHLALGGDESWKGLHETIRVGAEQLAHEDLSVAERHGIALAMRACRNELENAVAAATERRPTADSVAAQVQFELVVALCVYDHAGRLFRSAADYRSQTGDPFRYRVAQAVGRIFYGIEEDEPPEERFLREHSLAV